jgi:phage gp29-like protein
MAKNPRSLSDLVREPSPWGWREWAPIDLAYATRAAMGGNLLPAADLVGAMLADDRVAATVGVRVRGLLGLPFLVERPNDREGKTIARALELDFFRFAPEEALYQVLAWGLLLGVGLARLDWREDEETGRLLPHLEPWHPRNLFFDPQEERWYVRTREDPKHPLKEGAWWLYTPYGPRRPWEMGLWRAIALPWLIKLDAARYWARDNEVGAVRVARAGEMSAQEEREALARLLADMGADTGLVLPPGYEMDILSPSGEVWRGREAAIAWADRAIAVAVLGQNLTTEVQGGSYAAAQVHHMVRQDLLEADAEVLATSLREGVVRWWAEYNWGSARLAPWPKWDATPPEDHQVGAETLAKLAQALQGLTQAGAPVDLRAILEAYGVPVAQEASTQTVRLASGDRVALSSGFVQGQLYADRVADEAIGAAVPLLRRWLDKVLQAIEEAEGYEALRQRLVDLIPEANPAELAGLMEAALLLSELAGRYAVARDVAGQR